MIREVSCLQDDCWRCKGCGNHNLNVRDECVRCLRQKTGWKCLFCNHQHTESTANCENCGKKSGEINDSDFVEGANSDYSHVIKIAFVEPFRLAEIRMVVIGKMGVGKSAFCNTILGDNAFKSADCFAAVTKKAQAAFREVDHRKLLLIDTPGFRDENTTADEEVIAHVESIGDFFLRISPGFHCIVFVFNFKDRFTRDDDEILKDVVKIFGDDVLDHMILVFTHCPSQEDLKTKLKTATGALKDLLDDVEHRVFGIDNTVDVTAKKTYAKGFFKDVENLCRRNGQIYTNDMLLKAWDLIEKEVKQPEDRMKIRSVKSKIEAMEFIQWFTNIFRN